MRDPAGGGELAGIMEATAFLPQGVPPHWSTYREVGDIDDTLTEVKTLGRCCWTATRTTPEVCGRNGSTPL
jgi:predicted enzyme related to lactoylglutathione lyase